MGVATETNDQLRVDPICLRQLPHGHGERPQLTRIDHDRRQARLPERLRLDPN